MGSFEGLTSRGLSVGEAVWLWGSVCGLAWFAVLHVFVLTVLSQASILCVVVEIVPGIVYRLAGIGRRLKLKNWP